MAHTKTLQALLKETDITEQQVLELIAHSDDPLSFCSEICRRYGVDLTLREAEEIYLTAPLNIPSNKRRHS